MKPRPYWAWPAVIGLTLPFGVAMAGHTVFASMQCYSCHAINIPGDTLPDAGGISSDLTHGCATLPQEYLAESIIKANAIPEAHGAIVEVTRQVVGMLHRCLIEVAAACRPGQI